MKRVFVELTPKNIERLVVAYTTGDLSALIGTRVRIQEDKTVVTKVVTPSQNSSIR